MAGMRDFLEGTGGKVATVVLLVVAVAFGVFMFRNSFGTPSEVRDANTRVFVDATTGKPFDVEMKPGMQIPAKAPSGQNTGYPAELCWWTKDGKVRRDPYAVLLNSSVGKAEPTFCPDCGRLVVGHNPKPTGPNEKPPPTQAEYKAPRQGQPDER